MWCNVNDLISLTRDTGERSSVMKCSGFFSLLLACCLAVRKDHQDVAAEPEAGVNGKNKKKNERATSKKRQRKEAKKIKKALLDRKRQEDTKNGQHQNKVSDVVAEVNLAKVTHSKIANKVMSVVITEKKEKDESTQNKETLASIHGNGEPDTKEEEKGEEPAQLMSSKLMS